MNKWQNEGTKQILLLRARTVAHSAYCPYSKFKVGAAVLFLNDMDHHTIEDGCNVENASYSLTICAERTAIFKAISRGYAKLVALAVACPAWQKGMPISFAMPCGACRQVMAEFADGKIPIYVDGVGEFLLDELLPSPFTLK